MESGAAAPEFLATCWTTAGDVRPMRTGPNSPIPLERRIRAASDAGYAGMGLGAADLAAARKSLGFNGILRVLSDHGIKHLELEYLDNWWDNSVGTRQTRNDLLEAAACLGASHIKVGAGLLGQIVEPHLLRERFHQLAQEAQKVGVKIALEAAAFSMLPNIELSARLVRETDHPNAGLLLDIWHIYRSGTTYEKLTGLVPPGSVFAVELNDGLALPAENLYEDTFDNRLLCGHGDFDVVAFIQTLNTLGYAGVWGVEMMSTHHRSLEPEEAARQALDAAIHCVIKARASTSRSSFSGAPLDERLSP